MYRKLTGITVGILALILVITPVSAITFGQPDGIRHPNVGLVVADVPGDGTLSLWCSGTLISPTVFLTAGHCTRFFSRLGPARIWITFDSDVDPKTSTLLPVASIATHPGYNSNTGANDVGVILLAEPVDGITPGILPEENLLDQMKVAGTLRDQVFVNVGYGATADFKGNPPYLPRDGVRRFSTTLYSSLTQNWLHLLGNNDATGGGSVCFGDSGGPHFLGDSNMLVSVSSLADAVCRSLDMSQRVDTPSVRAFLDDFVTLP